MAYRDVVEVLADAGMPLRAAQVCQALGTGTEPRHREGMRSKLKRLAGRGWLVEGEPGLFAVDIHVLVDFIHVLEYLWRAAWCFHPDADPAAEPWVATHALKLLAGEVDSVITTLDQHATDAGLTASQRGGVDACIGYLQAKREFLGYDTALAAGWPIATGVIEGAVGI